MASRAASAEYQQLASSAFYAGYFLKSLLGLKCGMWSMNIIIACAPCSMIKFFSESS